MSKVLFITFFLLLGYGNAGAEVIASADKGKDLYLSYGCALCHGPNGDGHGINAQKLDPPPTDFHDPKTYLHGLDRDSIRRSIQYGIKEDNSIMPAFEDMSPEEIDQIINYLQSLQKKDGGDR